jgi:hypothetical protein
MPPFASFVGLRRGEAIEVGRGSDAARNSITRVVNVGREGEEREAVHADALQTRLGLPHWLKTLTRLTFEVPISGPRSVSGFCV